MPSETMFTIILFHLSIFLSNIAIGENMFVQNIRKDNSL